MTVLSIDVLDSAELVDAGAYRTQLASALAAGWRFAGTYVTADRTLVRTVLVGADGATRMVSSPVESGLTSSAIDLAPAANWDEREASDLFWVGFAGHEPLRPLVNRTELDQWTVPVRG